MTLMINARHLFYGISMLDRYKGTGWKKFYLIFGMCDESFSINYTAEIPEDVDRSWFMFFVTLLNHFYWFSGATLGGICCGATGILEKIKKAPRPPWLWRNGALFLFSCAQYPDNCSQNPPWRSGSVLGTDPAR